MDSIEIINNRIKELQTESEKAAQGIQISKEQEKAFRTNRREMERKKLRIDGAIQALTEIRNAIPAEPIVSQEKNSIQTDLFDFPEELTEHDNQ